MGESTGPICVTMVTDTCGVGQTVVALKSLFLSNSDENLDIHLITDTDAPTAISSINELAAFFNRTVTIHPVRKDFLKGIPLTSHKQTRLPPAANYRIKIGELLPGLDRTIYLDTDVIVENSLRGLWETNLNGSIIGGVIDSFDHRGHCSRLGYDPDDGYINSGVLLIDLIKYRQAGISGLITDAIRRNDRYIWRDQDAINDCLHGHILLLPLKYNVQQGFFLRNPDVGDRWISHRRSAQPSCHHALQRPPQAMANAFQ